MKYADGSEVQLGDVVAVPVPTGTQQAHVVMLGDSYEHADIDAHFLEWVERERVLRPDSVVIQWIGENPFAHTDSRFSPVGNFMFSPIDEFVNLEARSSSNYSFKPTC